MAVDRDKVVNLDRSKKDNHDASGHVGQCSLQGKADGQTRGTNDSDNRCRLNPKCVEYKQARKSDDHIVDDVACKLKQGVIKVRILCAQFGDPTTDPACNYEANNQNCDRAHDVANDGCQKFERQQIGQRFAVPDRSVEKILHVIPLPARPFLRLVLHPIPTAHPRYV